MADKVSVSNIEKAKGIATDLDAVNLKLASLIQNDSQNFKKFASIGVTDYIEHYFSSVAEVLTFSQVNVSEALKNYLTMLIETENKLPEEPGHGGYPGGGYPGGGNIGGNPNIEEPDGPGVEDPEGELPEEPGIIGPEIPDPPVLAPIDVTELEDLSLGEINGIVESLKDLAKDNKMTLDEMLDDDEFAEKIKKQLLESRDVPEDVKKLLEDKDPQVVRTTLQDIFKGKHPVVFGINPLNLGVVYSYLEKVARDNNLTIDELMFDEKNKDVLKSVLKNFGEVKELIMSWKDLSPQELQEMLLRIYDGDEIEGISDEAMDILRIYIDYLCKETGLDYAELLTDPKYAAILQAGMEEFAKTALFMETTDLYSTAEMYSVIGDLFNGRNPAALGMDENEVVDFQKELEDLARGKGKSVREVLSNKDYAKDVREALEKSKNAAGVGSVFSNQPDDKVQKVAKNIYNSEVDTTDDKEVSVSDSITEQLPKAEREEVIPVEEQTPEGEVNTDTTTDVDPEVTSDETSVGGDQETTADETTVEDTEVASDVE